MRCTPARPTPASGIHCGSTVSGQPTPGGGEGGAHVGKPRKTRGHQPSVRGLPLWAWHIAGMISILGTGHDSLYTAVFGGCGPRRGGGGHLAFVQTCRPRTIALPDSRRVSFLCLAAPDRQAGRGRHHPSSALSSVPGREPHADAGWVDRGRGRETGETRRQACWRLPWRFTGCLTGACSSWPCATRR